MSNELIRLILLVVHATAGTAALVTGMLVLWGRAAGWWHVLTLVVMTVSLVPSLALGWSGLSTAIRVVFIGLVGLAGVMTVVAMRGNRHLRRRGSLGVAGVDQFGFNVISLTVAGVVVPMLNLTDSTVLVVGVTLAAMLVTRAFVQHRRRWLPDKAGDDGHGTGVGGLV